MEVHERAIVLDAHAHPKPGAAEALDLGGRTFSFDANLPAMREGGVDAVFYSVPFLGSGRDEPPGPAQVVAHARALVQEVAGLEDMAEMAYSAADIRRIHRLGKRAVLLSIETRDPFQGGPGTLGQYFEAGIRSITMTEERLLDPASAEGSPPDGPLSSFGEDVVREMNRLGILIDISHIPDRLQLDLTQNSREPVVASHSCTRALNDIPREIPDPIIRAMADRGGVIGVTFFPSHISSDFPDQTVTVEDLVDHIDHIVRVAGVDHVGFGSDFLGNPTHTTGLESAAGLPNLTAALLGRGYSNGDVEKILGGNFLRVLEEVGDTGG